MAQQRAAYRIARQIIRSSEYQRSRRLAVYASMSGELSLKYVIKYAWKQGKCCYLPEVSGDTLQFRRYRPFSNVRSNQFGICESMGERGVKLNQLDMMLVPLVGFDQHHQRIGMGGGFYDRTLGDPKNRTKHSPILIGVAHRCQKVQKIPARPWDVPLHHVMSV